MLSLVSDLCLRVHNKIENNGYSNIETNGEKEFLIQCLQKLKSKNKSLIIFDVGANIGECIEALQNELGRFPCEIHAFEPTSACMEHLRQQNFSNDVILNHFGLSDKKSKARIFFDKERSGLASLYKGDISDFGVFLNQTEDVELIDARSYLLEKQISKIHLLKLDIEGNELNALKGFGDFLTPKKIDFIQFEYGGANLDSFTTLKMLFDYLEERGFVIGKVLPRGGSIASYSRQMENFLNSNFVAISPYVQ